MIAFPDMLVPAAQDADMAFPPDPASFDPDAFPHFHVFCCLQLGRPMSDFSQHWRNAKILAGLSAEQVRALTFEQAEDLGLELN